MRPRGRARRRHPRDLGTRLIEPGTGAGVWDPTGRLSDFSVDFPRLNNPAPLAENETGTNLPGRRPLPPDLAAVPHFNNLVYEFYGPLVEALVRPPFLPRAIAAGGRPVYVAGYNWRKSVRSTSTRIRSVVEEALRQTGAREVIIVAHSMGGLVSRFFLRGVVTMPGGGIRPAVSVVRHLVLLASPSHGAPQAYRQLKVGLERRDGQLYWIFTLRAPHMSSRDMMRNWDSVYELLPHQAYCSRFPNWLTFDTRAAGIADASVADKVYANPHVGFLERPNPAIAARLASRSRVDAALNCFFPTPTTLLYASHAATETGADVRRGTLYGFNVTVRTGPGDQTVPAFSGRADACPGRAIARLSRPAAHRNYAVDPAVIREVQRILLTAPPLPSVPPIRPPAPVQVPSRRPPRGPRPSGQPILAARARQPSR